MSVDREILMHDSGCYPLTIIGKGPGNISGMDSRTLVTRLEKISFAGKDNEDIFVKKGHFFAHLYGEMGEKRGIFCCEALYVEELNGIFVSNGDLKIYTDNSGKGPYTVGLGSENSIFSLNPDSTIRGYIVRMTQEEIQSQRLSAIKLRSGTEYENTVDTGTPMIEPMIENVDSDGEEVTAEMNAPEDEMATAGKLDRTLMDIHCSNGHVNKWYLKSMILNGEIENVSWNEDLELEWKNFVCETCLRVKMKDQVKRKQRTLPRAHYPFQIIYADTLDIPDISVQEKQGFASREEMPKVVAQKILFIVDEFSRMKFVLPLNNKSLEEIARVFDLWMGGPVRKIIAELLRIPVKERHFEVSMEIIRSYPVLELCTDSGTEFSDMVEDSGFSIWLRNHHMVHRPSSAGQQWQNGVVEGNVNHLRNSAICALSFVNLGSEHFFQALCCEIEKMNMSLTKVHGKSISPMKRLFGKDKKLTSPVENFAYGQIVYFPRRLIKPYRAGLGYYIGYNRYGPGSEGHRIYDPSTKTVLTRQKIVGIPFSHEGLGDRKAFFGTISINAIQTEIHSLEGLEDKEANFSLADEKEIKGIMDKKVFRILSPAEVTSLRASGLKDREILKTMMVRVRKADGSLKSRLVAKGYSQIPGKTYIQTFSATPMDCTINLVFAMAAHLKFELFVADCTQAFLQPPKPSNISLYGKLPTDCKIPGFCNGGEIVEFLKLLYGCKQSGRVWQVWLDDHILGFTKKGFKIKKSVKDQCLYLVFSGERLALMILVMVDDILGAGQKDIWDLFFAYLQSRIDITGGDLCYIWNSREIRQEHGEIWISQDKAMENFLLEYKEIDPEKYGETPETPESTEWLSKLNMQEEGNLDETVVKKFQRLLGKLLYFARITRPDIAHAINLAGQVAHRASEKNLKGLMRIVHYLRKFPKKSIVYRTGRAFNLVCFTDSNFGNEPFMKQEFDCGKKSTSGIAILANGGVVSYCSKLQSTVADSTGYAETIAIHEALRELQFLKLLLEEMKKGPVAPFPLFVDSANAISNLLQNHSYKQKMTKFHEIRISAGYQYAARGLIHPIQIESKENIADLFTKSNIGNVEKWKTFISRLFGEMYSSDEFSKWIQKLILNNFKKVPNDRVPEVYRYLSELGLDHDISSKQKGVVSRGGDRNVT